MLIISTTMQFNVLEVIIKIIIIIATTIVIIVMIMKACKSL